MRQVREQIAERRAHTDASLVAERASTDAVVLRIEVRTRQKSDDLVEHDRLLADERLRRFRVYADSAVAGERSASAVPNSAVVGKRNAADESKRVEREVMDAALEDERARADAVVVVERQKHEHDRAVHEARMQETDDQLSTERGGEDVTVTAFGEAKTELAACRIEESRRCDLLGIVTHDLRSPLTVIALNAGVIANGSAEPATREAGQDIVLAAARMERLLMDLLDVARVESGTLRIVKRGHDVGALVNEVHRSYQPLFTDRGMTFTAELSPGMVVASFDHDRVVQVLSNLLGNAMKFGAPNGTIHLHVEERAEEVELVVSDDGPGIAPSALPHIFKRFWQIDADSHRGLGLGLYICERILEEHGGRIWVESILGEGTTFRFTLPREHPLHLSTSRRDSTNGECSHRR